MLHNPISIIRSHIEELWSKITLNRWTDGFSLGMSVGESKAWREALQTVQLKSHDIQAFQDSAKNKTTKTATDGMELGYKLALDALREEVKARGVIILESAPAEFDKDLEDVA